jgi:glyoxylase-like metal-dependent hydrolase (beta-lactamase superfamily II)
MISAIAGLAAGFVMDTVVAVTGFFAGSIFGATMTGGASIFGSSIFGGAGAGIAGTSTLGAGGVSIFGVGGITIFGVGGVTTIGGRLTFTGAAGAGASGIMIGTVDVGSGTVTWATAAPAAAIAIMADATHRRRRNSRPVMATPLPVRVQKSVRSRGDNAGREFCQDQIGEKNAVSVKIETIISAPFAENSYVVWLAGSSEAFVVDPGFEPDLILDCLKQNNLKLVAILNTHGHVDHIAGNGAMKEAFPDVPIIIGEGDAAMLTDADLNMSGPFGIPITSPPADRTLKDGEVLEVAGMRFDVWEIPGHSPGHVVFYSNGTLLGGDVLFRESIGRTDFPGGSMPQLLSGIRKRLWPLPDETVVYPGHGPTTTIGHEKKRNPFLQ